VPEDEPYFENGVRFSEISCLFVNRSMYMDENFGDVY
jgi:hypothetical protein